MPIALAYLGLGDKVRWDEGALAVADAIQGHWAGPGRRNPDRSLEFALAWLLGWQRKVLWEKSDWQGCPGGTWSEFLRLVHDLIKEVRQWTAEGDLLMGAAKPVGEPDAHGRNARVPGLHALWEESRIPKQAEAICQQLARRDGFGCRCTALGWAQIASSVMTPGEASVLDQILDGEAAGIDSRRAVEAAIWQFLACKRLDALRKERRQNDNSEQNEDKPVIEALEAEIETPGSLVSAAAGDLRLANELKKLRTAVEAMIKVIDALQQNAPPGSMVNLDRDSAVALAIRADNLAKATRSCLLHHCLGSWDGDLSLWKYFRQAVHGNFANVIKASGLTSGMLFPILESEAKLGYVDVLVRVCADCTEDPKRERSGVVTSYMGICLCCQRDLSGLPETLHKMLIVADTGGGGCFLPVKVWKCKTCPPVYRRGATKFPACWELPEGKRQCSVSPDHILSERPTNAWRYVEHTPDDLEMILKGTVERMIEWLEESGQIEGWAALAARGVLDESAASAARDRRSLRTVLNFKQSLRNPALF